MAPYTSRQEEALRQALIEIFWAETIGRYHVDTALEYLLRCPPESIPAILAQVRLMVFTVSDMLAFHFIENAAEALEHLRPEELEPWVKDALEVYEAEGLQPAVEFFENPAYTAAAIRQGQDLPTLDEHRLRLKFLINGLLGYDLELAKGAYPHTDGTAIFMPGAFGVRGLSARDNRLLYKMAVVHKCLQLLYKSFKAFWNLSPDGDAGSQAGPGRLVLETFCLLDAIRIEALLERQYQGLYRELNLLKERLCMAHGGKEVHSGRESAPAALIAWIGAGYPDRAPLGTGGLQDELAGRIMDIRDLRAGPEEIFSLARRLAEEEPGFRILPQLKARLLPYLGAITADAAQKARIAHEQRLTQKLTDAFSAIFMDGGMDRDGPNRLLSLMDELKRLDQAGHTRQSGIIDGESVIAIVHAWLGKGRGQADTGPAEAVSMEGPELTQRQKELLDDLKETLDEMDQDLGGIPISYVTATFGTASKIYCPDIEMEDQGAAGDRAGGGPERGWRFYTYDEWDFRRERFRRNWCTIKEMELSATRGNFYENTMRAYRGQLTLLRRQFEFLRQEYRFLKRQKDGEDVDLDALVEAYVDLRAFGRASDYLFIRQLKDRRDLAVSFLVDMSASTEGWVSTAIKESLILLCEALTSLGDRYGIFGFSGMRRTGCHFFRIKDFGQEYDHTVKERINTIGPRDYTRMGAAIRHASFLLRQQEARVRLLMIISDGKPEDYDEYKGPYAIEDTRMAVIEAREQGITPFCITIDRQGREYLPRIFGQKNYVVIPDPALLHKRIPEMYRILTG